MGRTVWVVNPHEPTWTHVLKQGPKPKGCPMMVARVALVVLVGLAIGLMIR
jgi:hypothetical protein